METNFVCNGLGVENLDWMCFVMTEKTFFEEATFLSKAIRDIYNPIVNKNISEVDCFDCVSKWIRYSSTKKLLMTQIWRKCAYLTGQGKSSDGSLAWMNEMFLNLYKYYLNLKRRYPQPVLVSSSLVQATNVVLDRMTSCTVSITLLTLIKYGIDQMKERFAFNQSSHDYLHFDKDEKELLIKTVKV